MSNDCFVIWMSSPMNDPSKIEEKSSRLELQDLNFAAADPLAARLHRAKSKPWQIGLAAYGLALASSFLIALIAGTLLLGSISNVRALLEDQFYFISETIMVPLIWGYYLWIYTAPKETMLQLEKARILVPRQKDLRSAEKILKSPWIAVGTLLIAILATAIYFFQYSDFKPLLWYNTNLISLLVRSLLVMIPTAYAGCSIIVRGIVNVVVFKYLLNGLNINPLHPDRAGGLLSLGQYSLKTSYLIAIAGVIAAFALLLVIRSSNPSSATFFNAAILLYAIAAPISFFAPLGTARQAMQAAKTELLLHISRQFNRDFQNAYDGLDGNAASLKEHLEKIDQLKKMQSLAEAFPIWPFDIETIRRFILAITSPIFAIILSILSNWLTTFITSLISGG